MGRIYDERSSSLGEELAEEEQKIKLSGIIQEKNTTIDKAEVAVCGERRS